jgi:hypothetical protein
VDAKYSGDPAFDALANHAPIEGHEKLIRFAQGPQIRRWRVSRPRHP